ncbi:OsmC family protein [Candidatus Bathyarchaeota archaeon]|nr:OsmC family protein [Candidatus Bathyarchaeota archaeon]
MTLINANANLIENFRIAVDDGRAHSVCVDLPPEMGTDRGPTALELGVMSFAGCVATIFILMAKKTRVNFSGLEVNMKAEKPEGAKTVTKADYEVIVKSDEAEEKLRRVLELTRANCPVGLIFEKAGVEVSYRLEIRKQ